MNYCWRTQKGLSLSLLRSPSGQKSEDFSSCVHFSVRGSVAGAAPTVSVLLLGHASSNAFLMASIALLIQLIFYLLKGLVCCVYCYNIYHIIYYVN